MDFHTPEMLSIPDCKLTINSIIHENVTTTIVRKAVTAHKSVCFITHLAKNKASPANAAEPASNSIHIFETFYLSGKIILISVPLFSSLLRRISALWQAAPCFTIASPRPVPPADFERPLSTR